MREADRTLLDRVRQGDVAAFSELFHAHWTSLCTAAAVYTHDMAEAEEIVAFIFSNVWERRASLEMNVTWSTYLHRAVKHRTANWRRDRARRDELIQTHLLDEVPAMGAPAPLSFATLEREEMLQAIVDAIRTLPERSQAVFLYRWRDGWGYDDIAAVLGIGVSAAKMLSHRALQAIRRHVGER